VARAPGTLIGIPGRDFLVGSTGSDTIEGLGGDDVISTEPFGGLPGAPDSVDGGSGRDRILGVGHLKGGSGGDTGFNFAGSPTIDSGSADDLVYADGATDVRRCEGTL
jgi:Ca2+-binding RTX toxin-like protein